MKSKLMTKVKYEAAVFAVLLTGAALGLAAGGFYEGFVTFYLPDFSLGICSRFLAGELISHINPTPMAEWVYALQTVNLLIAVVLCSVLLGRYLAETELENRQTVTLFGIFLVAGCAGIDIFSFTVGFLDVFWLMITAVVLMIYRNRVLKYFVPLLCVAAVAFHPVFPLTFFPLIAGLLLYVCCTDNRRRGDVFVLTVSVLLVAAASVYFFAFEKQTLTMTLEEFTAYLSGKTNATLHENYFTFYLYGKMPTPDGTYVAESLPKKILYMPAVLRKYISSPYIYPLYALLVLPIVTTIHVVWVGAFRRTSDKLKKLFYVLCMLAPLAAIFGCVYSTDGSRWISYAVMCQLGLLLGLLRHKDAALTASAKSVTDFLIKNKFCVAAYFALYAAVFIDWL